MAVNVNVKKLKENATIPTYGTEYAAGADLYACIEEAVTIEAGETKFIGTGIAMEIPEGYAGLIYARSGLHVREVLLLLIRLVLLMPITVENLLLLFIITQTRLRLLNLMKELHRLLLHHFFQLILIRLMNFLIQFVVLEDLVLQANNIISKRRISIPCAFLLYALNFSSQPYDIFFIPITFYCCSIRLKCIIFVTAVFTS